VPTRDRVSSCTAWRTIWTSTSTISAQTCSCCACFAHWATESGTAEKTYSFICGADRLFPRTLDRLLALAERRRVQVVLLFVRLRDNALAALGTSDTCAFMRLSDYREAKEAADQVGRSHKFVLSQIGKSCSESFDEGTSRSSGQEQSHVALRWDYVDLDAATIAVCSVIDVVRTGPSGEAAVSTPHRGLVAGQVSAEVGVIGLRRRVAPAPPPASHRGT
jgi:hypothetical protein